MDEASQVDVSTGALALSCAKNVVIVGDKKQLPNVVTTLDKKKAEQIFSEYKINPAYDFSNHSFLSSLEVFIVAGQDQCDQFFRFRTGNEDIGIDDETVAVEPGIA